MLAREPVGAVGLALRKAGGAATTDQLAATTGLSRQDVLEQLQPLLLCGEVTESAGLWQVRPVSFATSKA